jgi:L-arabonate dehydrase
VPARRLGLDVSEDELARRRAEWTAPKAAQAERGYRRLHLEAVAQADEGCDLEFLTKPVTAWAPV